MPFPFPAIPIPNPGNNPDLFGMTRQQVFGLNQQLAYERMGVTGALRGALSQFVPLATPVAQPIPIAQLVPPIIASPVANPTAVHSPFPFTGLAPSGAPPTMVIPVAGVALPVGAPGAQYIPGQGGVYIPSPLEPTGYGGQQHFKFGQEFGRGPAQGTNPGDFGTGLGGAGRRGQYDKYTGPTGGLLLENSLRTGNEAPGVIGALIAGTGPFGAIYFAGRTAYAGIRANQSLRQNLPADPRVLEIIDRLRAEQATTTPFPPPTITHTLTRLPGDFDQSMMFLPVEIPFRPTRQLGGVIMDQNVFPRRINWPPYVAPLPNIMKPNPVQPFEIGPNHAQLLNKIGQGNDAQVRRSLRLDS